MRPFSVLFAAASLALLTACEAGNSIEGEWEAVQGDQVVILELQADSTFTMDLGSFTGEGTYSVDGRNLALTPEGALAASIPGGFTGEIVDRRTLSVCSPGGMCSEFVRID